MNYWLIFLTGLTTGGISCLAVQGGLLTATIANREKTFPHQLEPGKYHSVLPTLFFLVAKLISYTILGALLGLFGSFFQLSDTVRGWFQIVTGLLILGMALNMLEVHPVFRYFVLQPPKWVGRLLRNKSNSQHWFAPALLGVFTVLIPCGVTQGMELLALASGNPLAGAIIMFSFVLGTSPLFFLIGFLTSRLSEVFHRRFTKIAAIIIIFVSVSSVNSGLVLQGSNYSLDRWAWAFQELFLPAETADISNQSPTITASSRGYTPNKVVVQSGQPVTLNIVTQNNRSCSSLFTIPALGISRTLPITGTTQIVFTPNKPGLINFSCGMGMFTGIIKVI